MQPDDIPEFVLFKQLEQDSARIRARIETENFQNRQAELKSLQQSLKKNAKFALQCVESLRVNPVAIIAEMISRGVESAAFYAITQNPDIQDAVDQLELALELCAPEGKYNAKEMISYLNSSPSVCPFTECKKREECRQNIGCLLESHCDLVEFVSACVMSDHEFIQDQQTSYNWVMKKEPKETDHISPNGKKIVCMYIMTFEECCEFTEKDARMTRKAIKSLERNDLWEAVECYRDIMKSDAAFEEKYPHRKPMEMNISFADSSLIDP